MIRFLQFLVFVFCFCLFLNPAKSQIAFSNKAVHIFNDFPEEIININNFVCAKTHIYANAFYDTSVVYGYSSIGSLIFRKKYNKHESTFINCMTKSKENKITMCGFARGCDYVDNSQKIFITQLDTLGNTIFDNTFTNPYPSFNPYYFKGLIQYNDSSYYAISDSLLYHFGKNGSTIKVKNTSLKSCTGFIQLNNNHFLVSAKTGTITKLFEMDTAANIISQTNCTYQFNKIIKNSSGALYGLTTTSIIAKISTGYTVTSTTQLTQGAGNVINDIFLNNDSLFCSGNTSNYEFLFYKYDSVLSLNYLKQNNSKYIFPVKLTVNDYGNLIFLNRESSSNTSSNFYQSLIYTNKQSNFIIKPDAGVVDFTVDSSYIVISFVGPGPYYVYSYFRLKAKIFNYSTDTLKSFYVNFKTLQFYPNCGFLYTKKKYTNVIPPNTFTYVITPWLLEGAGIVTTTVTSGTLFNVSNACIWTSAPNDESDFDHTNDNFCKNVTTPFITGISEQQTLNEIVSVFPNPFTNSVNIKLAGLNKVELYSIQGKLIKSLHVTVKNSETIIETENLNAGIYILKLQTDNFTKSVKVVKQ